MEGLEEELDNVESSSTTEGTVATSVETPDNTEPAQNSEEGAQMDALPKYKLNA